MIFKKYWKMIVTLVVIASLFTATAAVQSDIPSDTQVMPIVANITSATILIKEPQYITLPAVVIEDDEPQTSGYKISYVDEEFDKHMIQVMKDFDINLDPSYVYATIFCESTFRNAVESSVGAIGYMQVRPSTRDYIFPMIIEEFQQYSELSKDLTDPYTNVIYGLYYFKHVAKSFGDTEVNDENISRVLTCYNRGVTGGKRYFNATGHWDSEYAKKVINIAQQIRTNGGI